LACFRYTHWIGLIGLKDVSDVLPAGQHVTTGNKAVICDALLIAKTNKKAVLLQGNRTMPQLFFSV